MNTHDFPQGSEQWLSHRSSCWNASDAPAMLGCSPYETRAELLRRLSTGISPEVDAQTQRIFDAGHRFEELARPLAEEIIGEDLGRVVGSLDVGLSKPLGASFDGITFMDDTVFEHKTLSEKLRYTPWDEGNGAHLPKVYRVQMEQQLLVSGAERALFMASKWEGDTLVEERHCWYVSDAALRSELLAGWKAFEADLAAYAHVEVEAAKPAGKAPETLPALRIVITGEVSDTNLDDFKEIALTAIRSVNRDLKTDQDFADSAKARKWCEDIESKVDGAKQHALSQTATIDALFRTLDEISAEARVVRLELEKLEKARTAAINSEIVVEATAALGKHIRELSAAMPADFMPQVPADFPGAIKSLRSVSSKRNAVDAELLRAKIAASDIATRIHANVRLLDQHPDHAFLFNDRKTIVLKATDDLQALVTARIAEHQAAEQMRQEKERAAIRAEEEAKAQREAAQKVAAEQAAARAISQAAAPVAAATAAPAPVSAPVAAPAAPVVARPAPVAADTGERINLGQINERIAPLSITAAGLSTLGFEHVATERASKLYRATDFGRMVAAMAKHLQDLAVPA